MRFVRVFFLYLLVLFVSGCMTSNKLIKNSKSHSFSDDFADANSSLYLLTRPMIVDEFISTFKIDKKNKACIYNKINDKEYRLQVKKGAEQLLSENPKNAKIWRKEMAFISKSLQKIYNDPKEVDFDSKDLSNSSAFTLLTKNDAKKLKSLMLDPKFGKLFFALGLPSTDMNNKVIDNSSNEASKMLKVVLNANNICSNLNKYKSANLKTIDEKTDVLTKLIVDAYPAGKLAEVKLQKDPNKFSKAFKGLSETEVACAKQKLSPSGYYAYKRKQVLEYAKNNPERLISDINALNGGFSQAFNALMNETINQAGKRTDASIDKQIANLPIAQKVSVGLVMTDKKLKPLRELMGFLPPDPIEDEGMQQFMNMMFTMAYGVTTIGALIDECTP